MRSITIVMHFMNAYESSYSQQFLGGQNTSHKLLRCEHHIIHFPKNSQYVMSVKAEYIWREYASIFHKSFISEHTCCTSALAGSGVTLSFVVSKNCVWFTLSNVLL